LGDADAAVRSYESALEGDPRNAYALYNLGKLLYTRGEVDRAGQLLRRALDAKPDFPEASVVLADVCDSRGDHAAAAALLESALRQRPDYAGAAHNLALVLGKLGDRLSERGEAREAEVRYRAALKLTPDRVDVLFSLAALLASQGGLAEAAAFYQRGLELKPDVPRALCNLGGVFQMQGRIPDAVACYQKAIALDAGIPEAHYNLGNIFRDQGRAKESLDSYRAALSLRPGFAEARWALAMGQIPVVYEDDRQPKRCREAFAAELERLERWFAGPNAAQGHVAVGVAQPFYLAYQEEDNRDLLRRYGELCVRLMREWSTAQKLPSPRPKRGDGAVRVGVVSQYFHSHPVWSAIVKGWFRHLNPERFRLHAFYLGVTEDEETRFARSRAAHFEQGARGLRQWAEAILGQGLDALIYPEIGMDPTALKLASLRLAPVQMTSWGHPETSGLPTMDYFLSAQSLEPRGAEEHYTERLVSLPRLGCCYEPLRVTPVALDLARLGIDGEGPVIVCAGVPFKYAPRHDRVLAEIAKALGVCRFVFFVHRVADTSGTLRARLGAAFARHGLDLDRFAVFLPWQDPASFYALLTRADVFLDTIGFSGFNTAMQALECGLPVVAWEGRFLRGRLASGILRTIGLDELVADGAEAYVELAVRLCRDTQYREAIREQIALRRARLYEDVDVIRDMERFLGSAARPG
jgi:protein O-GlcNAc transferase